MRFSDHDLARFSEVVLAVHAATGLADLYGRVSSGLARLIACDRSSFNDYEIGPGRGILMPRPAPVWWPRFGGVYGAHITEHPVFDPARRPRVNETISCLDPAYRRRWERSTLNHEYFVPLGIRYQLSTLIEIRRARGVGLAVNRSDSDFCEHDRALFNFVNPHLSQALLTRRRLAAGQGGAAGDLALSVRWETGAMPDLSAAAADLFQEYFGTGAVAGGRLPGPVFQWLTAQLTRLDLPAQWAGAPVQPHVAYGGRGSLVIEFVRRDGGEVLLALREARRAAGTSAGGGRRLTPRETEILTWIAEGKRNTEIAVILGISVRTVEKHVERAMKKLDAKSRADAVRQCRRRQEGADA